MPSHRSKGVQVLVDAQPVLDHVQGLAAKGMLVSDMAEQCGLSDRLVRGLFNGYYAAGNGIRRPVRRCTPETFRKAMSIRFRHTWTPEGFRPDLMRGLRDSKGLSRSALGEAAGICPESIQYWETGRSRPKYKKKMDAVLKVLGAGWEDVSGPVVVEAVVEDCYTMVFSDGVVDPMADYDPGYPCQICHIEFKSLLLLRTHPHPKVKVPRVR